MNATRSLVLHDVILAEKTDAAHQQPSKNNDQVPR